MSQRLNTQGTKPVVEYREEHKMFFVVYDALGVELAPAFSTSAAAREIAINAFYGVPFFTMIPTVPIGTSYPRPNIIYPRLGPVDIWLRIV